MLKCTATRKQSSVLSCGEASGLHSPVTAHPPVLPCAFNFNLSDFQILPEDVSLSCTAVDKVRTDGSCCVNRAGMRCVSSQSNKTLSSWRNSHSSLFQAAHFCDAACGHREDNRASAQVMFGAEEDAKLESAGTTTVESFETPKPRQEDEDLYEDHHVRGWRFFLLFTGCVESLRCW